MAKRFTNLIVTPPQLRSQHVKSKYHPPSREKLRLMAKASKEGGRAQCFKCRESFSMTYMRQVRLGNFTEPEWACKDCIEIHHLFVETKAGKR